ncbi:unnamed protein product [Knipowitschia caucasica]
MLLSQTITVLLCCTILHHTVTGIGIINGKKVPNGRMQYMVSVQSSRGHVCGGFLVGDRFVLTAAQCASKALRSVSVGNLNRKHGQYIKIEKQFKHPLFKTRDEGNDLLLLKLKESALTVGNVATIQLPNLNMTVKPDEKCQVAGWGAESQRGGPAENLMHVMLSIIDIETCKAKRSKLPDNVICTHEDNQNGFCEADAGGPLVCNDIAVGILSLTKHNEGHLPGVFADILKYLVWINEIINE